jgi:hypothetical protein
MKRLILLTAILALGCAAPPKTAYDWGKHDDRLYDLMKDPAKLEAYGQSLRALIEAHPDGKRLPPGVCGEFGFVLLASGKPGEAQRYFALEKTYYPESSKIMDRMIASCQAKAPGPDSTTQGIKTAEKS